jgi:hypothetical protein
MSETIPCSEAPDHPLRTGALSKRSDEERAQRRTDAEARRVARNVELMAMRAELATLWRVLREFIPVRPDFRDRASANLDLERLQARETEEKIPALSSPVAPTPSRWRPFAMKVRSLPETTELPGLDSPYPEPEPVAAPRSGALVTVADARNLRERSEGRAALSRVRRDDRCRLGFAGFPTLAFYS